MLHWWRVSGSTARELLRRTHPSVENEAGQSANTIFQIVGMTRPGTESSLTALVTSHQPNVS